MRGRRLRQHHRESRACNALADEARRRRKATSGQRWVRRVDVTINQLWNEQLHSHRLWRHLLERTSADLQLRLNLHPRHVLAPLGGWDVLVLQSLEEHKNC